jgi:hypothetical protein
MILAGRRPKQPTRGSQQAARRTFHPIGQQKSPASGAFLAHGMNQAAATGASGQDAEAITM